MRSRIDSLTPSKNLDLSRLALFEMKASIARIDEAFTELLELCASIDYEGNPLSGEIKTFNLRSTFMRHDVLPKVNEEAWCDVESRICAVGILDTLRWEQGEFRKLANPINALITVTNQCVAIAENDGDQALVDAIEHNGVSYRQHYARVFAMWNQLDAVFLYSALMMTELFYRANDLGTLTETDITEKTTALAS
jgi:hypothetical protein